MVFQSIIKREKLPVLDSNAEDPEYFGDLNLDQVVRAVTDRYRDFDLRRYFIEPLDTPEEIAYRQGVFTDLRQPELLSAVRRFSDEFRSIQAVLKNLDNLFDIQREGHLLESARKYCRYLFELRDALESQKSLSDALSGLMEYIAGLLESENFKVLQKDIDEVEEAISGIGYNLVINSNRITVAKPDAQPEDFSIEILKDFAKFGKVEMDDSGDISSRSPDLGHVQAEILKLVEKLYPERIGRLRQFSNAHMEFIDPVISGIYQEFQFYLSYIDYMKVQEKAGLAFCIPRISDKGRIFARNAFDTALALKLVKDGKETVTNDFRVEPERRILIVTGPNNGGKTTFARSIGQIFHLASIGVPVPASEAVLTIQDRIFSLFEYAEEIENLRGKLEDDLVRLRQIVERSTERSIVIINEMLSSTTVKDAFSIGWSILEMLRNNGSICIFVTFLDEFSQFESAASWVAQVDSDNPEVRTHRVMESEPNGLAYAMAIARKYGLAYEDIMGRTSND